MNLMDCNLALGSTNFYLMPHLIIEVLPWALLGGSKNGKDAR